MQPLVSILIPAFNAEEWIAATLRSALAQTYPRKEIIVIDDGSSDRTLEIARHFESACLRVLQQKNQGAAAARNKAFSLSQGDYIQWLDADDLLAPDKIARQVEAAGEGKRMLLSSAWGQFMYRPQRAKFIPTGLWNDLSPVEWLLRKLGQNFYMQTATWLVTRELTETAGPWDTRMDVDDDGEYFCRVLLASDGVRFVPEAKMYYRTSGAGRLSYIGRSNRKLEAQWCSMRLHIAYLRSLEDSERVQAACVKYLQNSLILFHPERPDIVDQVAEMGRSFGAGLDLPQLPWKYSWMQGVFGWRLARRAWLLLPQIRWALERSWDKALFRFENARMAENPGA